MRKYWCYQYQTLSKMYLIFDIEKKSQLISFNKEISRERYCKNNSFTFSMHL